jgi:hypothetical protein
MMASFDFSPLKFSEKSSKNFSEVTNRASGGKSPRLGERERGEHEH